MKFDIPDNFEDLDKIFKETEEDAPFDFAGYLEDSIDRIVHKYGEALLRLHKLSELNAPDIIIKSGVELACKYVRVLLVRKKEFIAHIHKVNIGDPLTDDFVIANRNTICMHLVKQKKKRLQEAKDQVPPLSDKDINEIHLYLMSIAFARENDPEPEWYWNHPNFPFIHAEVRVYTKDKDVAIHIADDETEWSDIVVIPFEDFNQPDFEHEVEECFETLRDKVKQHLNPR